MIYSLAFFARIPTWTLEGIIIEKIRISEHVLLLGVPRGEPLPAEVPILMWYLAPEPLVMVTVGRTTVVRGKAMQTVSSRSRLVLFPPELRTSRHLSPRGNPPPN